MTTREVLLDGGSPWGFRLHGGADLNQPLRISRVNPGSKAALSGIREGDFITTINGQSTKDISNCEAHALLRNSGNTLQLGLNEESEVSPRRRQYKTVHQETHSETIKSSSITSYTLTSSKIISQAESNENESNETSKINESGINDNTNPQPKTPVVSQESTCSSGTSTPSTYTEAGEQEHQPPTNKQVTLQQNMPDNNARTRRKRSRNQKHKKHHSTPNTETIPEENGAVKEEGQKSYLVDQKHTNQTEMISDVKEKGHNSYRVESPVRQKHPLPKSKSLDDDDAVKIQELSEVSESEDKADNKAIVSEAESDLELDLKKPEPSTPLSLPLDSCTIQEISHISPEEELTLRNFLEGLNLVNSPQDAAKLVFEPNTIDSLRMKKAQKRLALEQYFFPIVQNPRFLDVINEETGDLSDREALSITRHLKQGTPELDVPPKKGRKTKKERMKMCKPVSNPVILVGTKIVDTPSVSHGVASSTVSGPSQSAEVVFLEDSSGSTSPEPEQKERKNILEQNREQEEIPVPDLEESKNSIGDTEEKEERVVVAKNGLLSTHNEENLLDLHFSQLTPPPTPEPISPKNGFAKSEDFVVSSQSAPSPSPSLSSDSSRATSLCTVKLNTSTADMSSLTTEETNPPTLRELCVSYLISQPFGCAVLQELAEVSQSLDNLTNAPPPPPPRSTAALPPINSSVELPVIKPPKQMNWVGLATQADPQLLLCLSPTQKIELEKSRKTYDEAGDLLDLHEKFIFRSSHQTEANERHVRDNVEITSIKADGAPSGNRLLAIIREEPPVSKMEPEEMNSARLKAKDLTEWLELARTNGMQDQVRLRRTLRGAQRRASLPSALHERQMQYLLEKEREIQRELEALEEEKRKLTAEMAPSHHFDPEDYHISRRGDFAETKRPVSLPSTEIFRQQMYQEYMEQVAEREERKHHKVIKVTAATPEIGAKPSSGLEDEFMVKVKEKQAMGKLEIKQEDSGIRDGDVLKGAQKLPRHLQEFIDFTKQAAEVSEAGVWSPGQKPDFKVPADQQPKIHRQSSPPKNEPQSPVWTPKSATSSPTVERKEFKPVKFESPVLGRKDYSRSGDSIHFEKEPPWKESGSSSDAGVTLSSNLQKRLPTSFSSPGFSDFSAPRLPRAQNPTITLLQKAREGQLPKGASYIDRDSHQTFPRPYTDRPPLIGQGEVLYRIKNEYTSESDSERPRKMADLGPRQFEGIGPTNKDGMPLILKSEVKDANQSKWYKKMYDTIHKQKPHRDEYLTVRYKQRRGQYPYTSGYLSEPDPGAYDSDFTGYKYATLDRRRGKETESDYGSSTMPRFTAEKNYPSELYPHVPDRIHPKRIEEYTPGHSSIADKEAKEHLEQQKRPPQTKSFINQALKESGYESDSTLVFRRRDNTAQQFSPVEQKEAYKVIQKGGDVPFHGLRKAAPERPKEPEPPVPPPKGQHPVRHLQAESPRKYVENEVTIHYKTPVRQEIKEYLSEDELAYRQAEAMKKIYQEERERKYLQELQDMKSRRHTDNFTPSQKFTIPQNRFEDFEDLSPSTGRPLPRSPELHLLAKALYNFVGQTSRELTFRKGDLIHVRRQVDKNWYEGELNAMVGLFPVNYVEVIAYDPASKTNIRKPHEGQARAKFKFVAQTHLELSLAKGEIVVLTRRVDDNWFEGKIGGRKGIFPASYIEVLVEPSEPVLNTKPVAAPAAHSLLLNGSAGGKESMGSHSYTPNLPANQMTSSYHAKPVQVTGSGNYGSLSRGRNPVSQALHIETHSEAIPYRALYKYLPQNDDELELLEGDTVYVLEKCDDGWYVGSSDRTGAFGTFPGNYVEKK